MWPFSRQARQTVRVCFIDAADDTVLDEVDVPIDRLPESFARETTFHVREDDWTVESADPATADVFKRTGKLRLRVRRSKPQMVDPSEVLFSLPTLNGTPPRRVSVVSPGDLLAMHEDDWRQFEWVSGLHARLAEAELADIRNVYEIDRVGIGFRRLHERQRIAKPLLDASIEFNSLKMAVGPDARWLDGVSFHLNRGVVDNSFAARMPGGIEFYGTTTDDDFLECLAFSPEIRPDAVTGPDVQTLLNFATMHNLLLVDWVRARMLRPEEPVYRALFHSDG